MPVDIGPKIGIEGERQFRQELEQINQGVKTLASEAKSVEAAMRDETDAEKKSAAQKDILNRQILAQKEKLEKLEQGLKQSADKYGEANVKTQRWQQAVYDAQTTLSGLESKLIGADQQVEEISDDIGDAEKATVGWADVMKGSLLADAVKAGLSKVKELVQGAASSMWEASKAGAAYADEMLTLADTTGVSADVLQEFRFMEGLADVEVSTIAKSMQKLKSTMTDADNQASAYARKMAEAANETNEQKRAAKEAAIELGATAAAYEALGVTVKEQNGEYRSAEDVFFDVVDALGKIDDETERDTIAMKLMGKSATDLNPVIKAGSKALNSLRQEAKDTGYVLSGSALTALGKQQNAMDRLEKKTEALKNSFSVKLATSMERAYSAMGEALANPRVSRGLDVLAEGVGSVIDGVTSLASTALPQLLNLLAPFDNQLKYLTDDQIALFKAVDDSKQAHDDMVETFKDSAQGIIDETKRTEGLWKELQTLVDENGNVKKKDEERVNYITSELKEALGIQMELEDGILKGYQDQQKEIDNLIKKREAEALITAGKDQFVEAQAQRNKALEEAAKLAPQVEEALLKLTAAEDAYRTAEAESMKQFDDTEEDETRRLRYMQEYSAAVSDAREEYELLRGKYQDASQTAAEYFSTVDKWERAQEAAANGHYNEVVRILTDEFGVTLDYYLKKKQLNDQEKADLKQKIADQELVIAEYKKNLEKGLSGFSESGLAEMEAYVQKAKDILDGKRLGELFLAGLVDGLKNKNLIEQIEKNSSLAAYKVDKAARLALKIESPSKRGKWIGEMWDEGLVKGLTDNEAKLTQAAESLADTLVEASTPYGRALIPGTGVYGSGAMSAPIGSSGAGSSSSYTTNMGGITVRVDGADGVNEDILAQRIAVRLTDELNRARRGRA